MKRKPKVLICNPGTLHAFRLARELKYQGIEITFATSLFIPKALFRLLPASWKVKLANRSGFELDGHVVQYPVPELIHLLLAKLLPGKADLLILWRNRLFGRWVVRKHLSGIDIVWSFDTACEHIFRVAKNKSIFCILDMSIAHPLAGEAILQEHATRHPEFWDNFNKREKGKAELQSRENELLLADIVVTASTFTATSIQQYSQTNASIKVIPYGVDLSQFQPLQSQRTSTDLVTFLFVSWFSQRKGVYDLLRVWEHSGIEGKAKLLLAGGVRDDLRFWKGELPVNVKCVGRIARENIGDLFNSSDVFVFPSLFEGFGLVILEAMASGLPVITTTNTAGPDLINEAVEGFVSMPGDMEALEKQMLLLAENQALINMMSKQARKKAEEYTWEEYGKKCARICQELCS